MKLDSQDRFEIKALAFYRETGILAPGKDCKRRRRIVVLYYEWHEPLAYCTACGEMPNDSARRFKKVTFARERKIAKARSLYESATSIDEVMRRLTEDLA